MTVTEISVAELARMLDGGGDGDWVPLCRARTTDDGAVLVQLLDLSGDVKDEWLMLPGENALVQYTLSARR